MKLERREFLGLAVGLGLKTILPNEQKPHCTSYALGHGTPVAVPAGTCRESWQYCCDKNGEWKKNEQSVTTKTQSQPADLQPSRVPANEAQTYEEWVAEMRALKDGLVSLGTAVTLAGGAIYLVRRLWNRTLGSEEWRNRE